MKIEVEDLSAKLLESAIWMYAYDFDEAAVHLVAGAAFEQYTKRLGFGAVRKEVEKKIKLDKKAEFWSLFNKNYTFFKHGEYKRKPLEEIEYDPAEVEGIILLACEANLEERSKYKLRCAEIFYIYMALIRPDLFTKEVEEFSRSSQEELKKYYPVVDRKVLAEMLKRIKEPLVKKV